MSKSFSYVAKSAATHSQTTGANIIPTRSFVVQRALLGADSQSPANIGRLRQLDAGVLQTLSLQAQGAGHQRTDASSQNASAFPAISSVTPATIQRFNPPVTPTPTAYRSAAAIYGGTLGEFHQYAQDQADWANSPAPNQITPQDRRALRRILEFANTPNILAGCSEMSVQSIKDKGLTRSLRRRLRVYCRAVNEPDAETVDVGRKTDIDEALDIADALIKLERQPGGPVIKTIFDQQNSDGSLEKLISKNAVDPFIQYVRRCRPVLHAYGGTEIESFIDFLGEVGGDPLIYRGRLRHVRNFHRFHKKALDRLLQNQADRSRSKPLALILHSALDDSGAFHRDPNLTNAITDNRNNTLMVEGSTSLSQVQSLLRPLARRYGQHRRIGQVMIAGHGLPRTMELAGSVDADTMDVRDDALDLDGDARQVARTHRFFQELMRNMGSGPHSRIVLNACLTAANEVPGELDPDPAIAQGQISAAIAASPSLATHLQSIAARRGQAIDVLGANGSFSEGPALMNPATGLFDIIPPHGDDPSLVADKFTYVRNGWEPEGALRAVLECWATDKARCLQLVGERHNNRIAGNDSWDETIINTAYGIVLAHPDNANLINKLARNAWIFAHSQFRHEVKAQRCRLWDLPSDLPLSHINTIITALTHDSVWTGEFYVRLAFRQFWLMQAPDASRRSSFLNELSGVTCDQANQFVDIPSRIHSELPQLLPTPAGASPNTSRVKLALIGVKQGDVGAGAASETYLKSVIGVGNRRFPASLNVESLLGGLADPQDILNAIGLGSAGGGTVLSANIDLDQDGTNDFYVDPMTRRGAVTARALNVRARPSTAEAILGRFPQGRRIAVTGRSGDWYATDYNGRTAFVHGNYVRLARPL